MPPVYLLRIVSPDRVVFEGQVQSLVAPGRDGSFGVLFEHAPLVAELTVGELRLVDAQGNERHFAIAGGFLEVSALDEVTIVADAAEAAQDIDVARARAAEQRAAARLAQTDEDVDNARAQAALRRALNRLRVAERT